MNPPTKDAGTDNARLILIRDVLVFQCKLIADGFRDLLLLPLSLVAGLISLVGKGGAPGPAFYDLLRLGRRSERWINLFGTLERKGQAASDDDESEGRDFDEIASRVESFLVEEYRKRGVTAQARRHMDEALELLRGARKRRVGGQRAR